MKRSQRGIALFLVFAVTALMLVLMGAFVQLNSHQFSFINNTDHRANLERAARSVYEYCFYRLEHEKSWGAAPFVNDGVDGEVADTLTVNEIKNTTRVAGEVVDLGTQYEVVIHNNIEGTAESDGVPPGGCRLDISVDRGSLSQKRQVLLYTAPLYDSSAVSTHNINFDANQLNVASTDPTRNFIRSKQSIHAPAPSQVDFQPAPNSSEKGVLWANGGIHLGSKNMEDPTDLQAAVTTTKGRFLPRSKTYYEVHDLQRSEVQVAGQEVTINPGIYVFTQRNVTYINAQNEQATASVNALERRAYAVVDGHLEPGDVQELWYYNGSLPNNYDSDEWVSLNGDLAVGHAVNTLDFYIDPTNLVAANLSTATVSVSANVNLKVDGDFGVFSQNANQVPSVQFLDGDWDGQVDRGSISASGEITIEGNVFGSGKLLADGSVSLYPNYADIEGDTKSDLSIYSGNNVNVRTPDAGFLSDLAFRGLVYAKNDIDIHAGGRSISVEGAMVSQGGDLSVHNANNINLKYNPAYLDTIVKKLPGGRVQLERGVWIP
ncbi:MAG: hypothetical protein KC910_12320 [Candidatus Eremiobacteraeota bacterium]|nr:hypothetical protein [Candidatus Eremiobacteraeota bacterium]